MTACDVLQAAIEEIESGHTVKPSGILSALRAAGFVVVPALIYLLRMPTRIVIGTSQFQVVFVTAFTTVLQSTQNYSVDLLLAAPLMFVLAGKPAAAWRSRRGVPPAFLPHRASGRGPSRW